MSTLPRSKTRFVRGSVVTEAVHFLPLAAEARSLQAFFGSPAHSASQAHVAKTAFISFSSLK